MNHSPSAINKRELRREIRRRRRALPPHDRANRASRMTTRLTHLPAWRQARRIGLFIAADGEISPGEALRWAWRRHLETYLPVLTRSTSPRMHFYRYGPDDSLQPNHYGIPEPAPRPRFQADPRFLDVVLTPLVAFDDTGARLGMGGGFYDRSFAFLRHRERWKRPKLIGIAYDFQRVDTLPVEPWDVMLDGIVTDHAVYGTLADTTSTANPTVD